MKKKTHTTKTNPRELYEDQLFRDATAFRVIKYSSSGTESCTFTNFPDALKAHKIVIETNRSLLYAIAQKGTVCCVKERWPHFMTLWNEGHV